MMQVLEFLPHEQQVHVSYTVNTITADDLVKQWSKASADTALTQFSRNKPVSATEWFG